MRGYERIRDMKREGTLAFRHLDVSQLFKHALGALAEARRRSHGRVTLVCLHAEPTRRPDGRAVPVSAHAAHRSEIEEFAAIVGDDEVAFLATTWREMLALWSREGSPEVRVHVEAVLARHGVWL